MKKVNFNLYDYYFTLWYDIGSIYKSELSEYYASLIISVQYMLFVGIGYKGALIFELFKPASNDTAFIGALSIMGFVFLVHFFLYILTKRFRDVLFTFKQKKKKNKALVNRVKIFLFVFLALQIIVAMYIPYNI